MPATASAYLNLGQTTTFRTIVRRAASEARLPNNQAVWQVLAQNENEGKQELVDIVNQEQLQMLDEFPILNETHADSATVAGQQYIELPTDLRDADIYRVFWNDDSIYEATEVTVISQFEADALPESMRNGQVSVEYPLYAAIDPETYVQHHIGQAEVTLLPPRLNFYPMPSAAKAVRILYRASETQFDTSDFDSSSKTVSAIPDRLINLLAMKVGLQLAKRAAKYDIAQVLAGDLANELPRWQMKIARTIGQEREGNFELAGFPRTGGENRFNNFELRGRY